MYSPRPGVHVECLEPTRHLLAQQCVRAHTTAEDDPPAAGFMNRTQGLGDEHVHGRLLEGRRHVGDLVGQVVTQPAGQLDHRRLETAEREVVVRRIVDRLIAA